ncbi:oxidoreductase [Putridiphycobacter roseus]|uniref:Oxidoreductase n=1 Tax=Putridiphycobacter roseus TaxID=2219161 RepID=A0A2W1NDF9_9FLAO|nr:GMC family oxidoreductase [Putridiphycobacter roseus]PZE17465.1 oxidoreductase [Putridiphycobacter roseus]
MKKYDICIVGSGAGAGPIIYELAKAGFKVCVLEKGPALETSDFSKDEYLACRKDVYASNLQNEFHEIESFSKSQKKWKLATTKATGRTYWNGNMVGGSSNLMSAYFHRLKPNDFKLLSTYGKIEGANVADWPIDYNTLEPYYAKVEEVVGVSGEVRPHSTQEPRSTKDFPYPPLKTNLISEWLDKAALAEGYSMVSVARGIISKTTTNRNACYYSNFCGSYGCSSNAKSSSRVALIYPAMATGNCTLIPNAKVYRLETDGTGKVAKAHYYLKDEKKSIEADIFVVAAQAIESSRLLLMSRGKLHPNGIGNQYAQVGKNIIFSAGGIGSGNLFDKDFSKETIAKIKTPGLWVNRAIQHWYEIDDPAFNGKVKGGTVDFVFEHANPMPKLMRQKWGDNGLVYGSKLKENIQDYFLDQRKIKFEIFNDWLPTDNCMVSLSETEKDKWGDPVAKVKIGYHPHDLIVARFLADKAEKILVNIGAKNISTGISSTPSPNLVAGGCRFGEDPKESVLDKNCKVHDCDNLYVADASFMPTGGSVPYTWTIYANSFRVADVIKRQLTI